MDEKFTKCNKILSKIQYKKFDIKPKKIASFIIDMSICIFSLKV